MVSTRLSESRTLETEEPKTNMKNEGWDNLLIDLGLRRFESAWLLGSQELTRPGQDGGLAGGLHLALLYGALAGLSLPSVDRHPGSPPPQ